MKSIHAIGPDFAVSHLHAAPKRRNEIRILLYATLLALDILALICAFELGALIRYGHFGWHSAMDALVVTLPIYVVTAFNNGAYSIKALRSE